MEPVAGVSLVQIRETIAEDDIVGGAIGVQVDDVPDRILAVQVAQHAHNRGDPAAGSDEENRPRRRIRKREVALDAAEPEDLPGTRLPQ